MFWTISIQQRNSTKQARLFELPFAVYGAAFSISANKTQIVSESHAEVNSSNISGLKHSLCLSAHEHKSEKGWDTQGRERVFFFPSGADEGLPSLHGEMCATARTHLLGEKRATARPLLLQWSGMCEGATYGKAVPSRFFHLRSASWP